VQLLATGAVLSFCAASVFAQTGASGLAGVVRDTSGAVLPGVTVQTSVLDAVPSARAFTAYAPLTPSVQIASNAQDVGGSKGDTMVWLTSHGSSIQDSKIAVDGFETNFGAGNRLFIPNPYNARPADESVDHLHSANLSRARAAAQRGREEQHLVRDLGRRKAAGQAREARSVDRPDH
jgi:hypothetical protein